MEQLGSTPEEQLSSKTSNLSVIAFIMTFLLPFVGIILGITARREIDKSKGALSGRKLATASIWLGSVAMVGYGILIASFIYLSQISSTESAQSNASALGTNYGMKIASYNAQLTFENSSTIGKSLGLSESSFKQIVSDICSGVNVPSYVVGSGQGGIQLYPNANSDPNYKIFNNACLAALGYPAAW